MTLGTIYTPNEEQERFIWDALAYSLLSHDRLILIGGDLNLVMDNLMGRSPHMEGGAGAFWNAGISWLKAAGLVDL